MRVVLLVLLLVQLMESQLDTWMDNFHKFLTMPDNPALAERDEDKESVMDAVRSAVCHNINLVSTSKQACVCKCIPMLHVMRRSICGVDLSSCPEIRDACQWNVTT